MTLQNASRGGLVVGLFALVLGTAVAIGPSHPVTADAETNDAAHGFPDVRMAVSTDTTPGFTYQNGWQFWFAGTNIDHAGKHAFTHTIWGDVEPIRTCAGDCDSTPGALHIRTDYIENNAQRVAAGSLSEFAFNYLDLDHYDNVSVMAMSDDLDTFLVRGTSGDDSMLPGTRIEAVMWEGNGALVIAEYWDLYPGSTLDNVGWETIRDSLNFSSITLQ